MAGREVYFDAEGYIWDAKDWTHGVAEELGREDGIARLDETQWRIVEFYRDFYLQNGRSPMNREARTGTGMTLLELEAAFPQGLKLGARRLAGLPNPATCLDRPAPRVRPVPEPAGLSTRNV